MNFAEVVQAWDRADPKFIHPAREHESEAAYQASGQQQADAIAELLSPGATVLDFGCGDGRVAIPLHQHGFHVIAADSSVNMLNRLSARKPEIGTLPTDGSDLTARLGDLALDDVDAVVCLAVLIHHDHAGGRRIIEALAEVLHPGGLMILHWPSSESPSERRTWIEVTTWSAAQQEALLGELGLRDAGLKLPPALATGVIRALTT